MQSFMEKLPKPIKVGQGKGNTIRASLTSQIFLRIISFCHGFQLFSLPHNVVNK